MSVGQRLRQRRMELNMTQAELARRLGVTPAVVSNYESGQNPVRSELLEKLIQVLDVEPNVLFQDIYRGAGFPVSGEERRLVERYRGLTTVGRQTLQSVAEALEAYQADLDLPAPEVRQIPLYRCPAAAGLAAPVFGEDFDYIEVTGDVPRGAEFAVRIQGDSMEPYIRDGSIVYVNRDPLASGDVGIFCVDGEMLCKQYVRDRLGMVYLFSLNRKRADADVILPRDSGRSMVCFGRVLLPARPPAPSLSL